MSVSPPQSDTQPVAPPTRGALRVVIVQSSAREADSLAGLVAHRNDQVWQTTRPAEALTLLARHKPNLLLVDLHLPGTDWLDLLRAARQAAPAPHVIVTNKYPDLRREILAREQGVQVFLRQPFTRQWVERALERLRTASAAEAAEAAPARAVAALQLPRVRFPVGLKIALPYILLALAFAVGAAYMVSRYILDTLQERLTAQLVDVGTLAADWMVREETELLATLRLLARTEGMAEAISADDAEAVRRLALPITVNDQPEAVEILNALGTSVLSLRRLPGSPPESYETTRGDSAYRNWPFVLGILGGQSDEQGDKYAGAIGAPWGHYFYVSGPVFHSDGRLAGAVLVGISLPTLVREIRADTLAQVTVYDLLGNVLESTLPAESPGQPLSAEQAATVLLRQADSSLVRDASAASATYTEIVGPWQVRGGDDLGLLGTALSHNYFSRPTPVTRFQAFGLAAAAFLIVIALGGFLARRITRPLSQMVNAAAAVAQGNLEVKVDTGGDDEVAVLAHAFNHMVSGLQEGSIYRDLLGRAVSPEVREQLRVGFASGHLRLEGQNVVATVLMTDIRGFTTLAEKQPPTTVLAWLNEYFGEVVPVITRHGGVVDKFDADAVLAFFGILPKPLPPADSAYQACQAAAAMLQRIEQLNQRRVAEGQPPMVTGIGVNTGLVTAGGLGASDRLNYTVIGDTVNTAQRLEGFTREFGVSGVVISEFTHAALGDRASDFDLEPLGAQVLRGRHEAVKIYRLRSQVAQRRSA